MSIITILMAFWFFSKSKKLYETKDIKKHILLCPTRIKDVEQYANLYSKIYFWDGVFMIALVVYEILDKFYLHLSFKTTFIIFLIIFAILIAFSILINNKAKKFQY